ncbi:hypothetical protein [Domibacillus epiphyticus]|uniref:Uncharacterized protein n=1 Tax=Domibacillus epiphyticus TaxID=1714355 RepID=A0A1V2ABW2_9BACI|nr:hypothetical protein [Domibacillus epiphyticus]OMP68450.1 hypothetical protein BTO28_02180 [Domibacillus epiphyticus]
MAHHKITEEEESNLPMFNNHQEASEYFKTQYGDDFILKSSKEIDGETVYVYVLVVDREAYKRGQEKLARFEIVQGTEFTDSFQSINISENGDIFITH